MTTSSRQADALLTDHFTYTPLSLIDDIINAVNTIIYQALDALEDGLLNVPPAQLGFKSYTPKDNPQPVSAADAAKDEIENGVHQLETLLESTVDKSFDKLEIYTLRNILTVPEDLSRWIRLSHYENLPFPVPSTAPTPESITSLHRQVQETTKLNLALKAKHARNAAMIAQVRSLLSPPPSTGTATNAPQAPSNQSQQSLAFLAHPSQSSTTKPLTTQAQFATSQLPALKELVVKLRPEAEKLRVVRGSSHGDRDTKREERRQYIEGGVRRVVVRSGVGGGEGDLKAMEGERRGREEVEMLEGVVRGFESGGGGE